MLRVMVALGFETRKSWKPSMLRSRGPCPDYRCDRFPSAAKPAFPRLKAAARDATLNVKPLAPFYERPCLSPDTDRTEWLPSELALLYAYAIYLVGVQEVGVEMSTMRRAVAEFFFMAALTFALTRCPAKTRFEADLAALEHAGGACPISWHGCSV